MTMMMAMVATTKSPATATNKQIRKGLYCFKIYYHIKFVNSPIAPASEDCIAAMFGITDGIKLEIKTEVAR